MKREPLSKVLIIDDDRGLCETVKDYLASDTVEVLSAHTGKDGLALCARSTMDVVLLDQKLPDAEGVQLCGRILKHNERAKILFITAFPNLDNAIEAVKVGAYDYLSKPFELEELSLAIKRALRTVRLERIEQIEKYKSNQESDRIRLIEKQSGLAEVWKLVRLVADTDSNVLITGETGTGKSLIAKAIHYTGELKHEAFVSINCTALPESLIEAELFGYEKGAFSGASRTKKGILELAEGGTLFLDEIGDMAQHLQSKLLAVLDEKKFMRLGGETVRQANVRIIAATNRNLEEAVRQKSFRSDLYYRLGVITIHVPPLRERKQDVRELCGQFIDKLATGAAPRIAEDEIERLCAHNWPGNVRELKNIIERSIIIQKGPILEPSRLLAGKTGTIPATPPSLLPSSPSPSSFPPPEPVETVLTLDDMERRHIGKVLAQCSGNLAKSARALDISLSTLKRKVKKYGLSQDKPAEI